MAVSKAQQKAVSKYMKENYDEIKVRVPKGSKDAIKAQAEKSGESVNGFIFRAITELSEQEQIHRAYLRSLLRSLRAQKKAFECKDYTEAKKLLDGLIEDTEKNINHKLE